MIGTIELDAKETHQAVDDRGNNLFFSGGLGGSGCRVSSDNSFFQSPQIDFPQDPEYKKPSPVALCCTGFCLLPFALGTAAAVEVAILEIGVAVLKKNHPKYASLSSDGGHQIAAITGMIALCLTVLAGVAVKKSGIASEVEQKINQTENPFAIAMSVRSTMSFKRQVGFGCLLGSAVLGVGSIALACLALDEVDEFQNTTAALMVGAGTLTASLMGLVVVCLCCAAPTIPRHARDQAQMNDGDALEGGQYRQFSGDLAEREVVVRETHNKESYPSP